MLFASDLDNTLVYSHKLLGPQDAVMVDEYRGAPCCYMTDHAYRLLQRVSHTALFVPVTTRSLAQYRRMRLLERGMAAYALAANGGILLAEGEVDAEWYRESLERIRTELPLLEAVAAHLRQDRRVTRMPELVDGLFLFAKSRCPGSTLQSLPVFCSQQLTVCAQGEKLYAFPRWLNKGEALRRLREKLRPRCILAAGDTALDLPMLAAADLAFVPEDFPVTALPEHVRILQGDRLRFADRLLDCVLAQLALRKAP